MTIMTENFNTWDQMLKFSVMSSFTRYSVEDAEM